MASLLHRLAHLLHDPPADFVFEISEAGIAWARPGADTPAFQPLQPAVLSVSPLSDNVLKPDAFADAIRRIAGGGGMGRKRRRAVVILPDHAARVAVLRFEQFPTDPKEQASLVRFRMKKSVPFDVETAAISYHATAPKPPMDVVVAVASLEIVARYEAAFRAAGLHAGHVTTAAIAAAELNIHPGTSLMARRVGPLLTVSVLNGAAPRLIRTVELASDDAEEVLGVLFPTLAYVEDELRTQAARILLCGFDEDGRAPDWVSELQIPAERLQSRFGVPDGSNSGLFGYLESISPGAKAA
jgi:type IV pilus assembly protein PilM